MQKIVNRIFELSKSEKKTLIELGLKCSEEVGEMAQAILSYADAPGCGYKGKSADDVIEEAVDTIIVALCTISRVQDGNVDEENVKAIFRAKLDRWVEKSISKG
jgi:NTP pyrophosphatase (non-canonical NTP hydrolase)